MPDARPRPLVLLHGGAVDHRMWRPQLDAFPERRVVAVDARGHGRSSTPSSPFRHCDDVIEVLRSREGKQHVVITGRRAPAALVDAADLVTEMVKTRHPMDAGRKGQKGIEW